LRHVRGWHKITLNISKYWSSTYRRKHYSANPNILLCRVFEALQNRLITFLEGEGEGEGEEKTLTLTPHLPHPRAKNVQSSEKSEKCSNFKNFPYFSEDLATHSGLIIAEQIWETNQNNYHLYFKIIRLKKKRSNI